MVPLLARISCSIDSGVLCTAAGCAGDSIVHLRAQGLSCYGRSVLSGGHPVGCSHLIHSRPCLAGSSSHMIHSQPYLARPSLGPLAWSAFCLVQGLVHPREQLPQNCDVYGACTAHGSASGNRHLLGFTRVSRVSTSRVHLDPLETLETLVNPSKP